MVKITYVTYAGVEREVDVPVGMTIMEGAVQNSVDGIDAVCGGNCYCGTCRIYVSKEWQKKLVPAAENELGMIEASGDDHPDARLGCQIPVTDAIDGIRVTTPKSQT